MRSYDLSALRLLIADDSPHMRMLLRQVLRSLGVRRIAEAADGVSALKEIRATPPDVIIADWEMQPVDGLQLVRSIRTARDSANPYVSIIMLTAYTETFRIHQARDAGINEYLAKPVSARALYGRLVNAIERTRQFVTSPAYTGPCRRRRSGTHVHYAGPDRRK